jgi:hypothetical protein
MDARLERNLEFSLETRSEPTHGFVRWGNFFYSVASTAT